ncbi:hypothetical protein DFH07DRAFT_776846 [Mycena maculata]|uniref:Uncharacterized protein n=1 Tax=Mycena maculata TaxID=230809 RepID=A0AAD7N4H9_9AGAR|nr:hypothetical protein DFH07DRAFT_776846 [Mycena maculata]
MSASISFLPPDSRHPLRSPLQLRWCTQIRRPRTYHLIFCGSGSDTFDDKTGRTGRTLDFTARLCFRQTPEPFPDGYAFISSFARFKRARGRSDWVQRSSCPTKPGSREIHARRVLFLSAPVSQLIKGTTALDLPGSAFLEIGTRPLSSVANSTTAIAQIHPRSTPTQAIHALDSPVQLSLSIGSHPSERLGKAQTTRLAQLPLPIYGIILELE